MVGMRTDVDMSESLYNAAHMLTRGEKVCTMQTCVRHDPSCDYRSQWHGSGYILLRQSYQYGKGQYQNRDDQQIAQNVTRHISDNTRLKVPRKVSCISLVCKFGGSCVPCIPLVPSRVFRWRSSLTLAP